MRNSQIDNESAGKIFNLIEQEIRALPDGPEKHDSYLKMHAARLNLYAEKGFAELQIAMNRAIEFVDHVPDSDRKIDVFEKLFVKNVEVGAAVPRTRIFNAIKAPKESDAKKALLIAVYSDFARSEELAPAWAKSDFRLKPVQQLKKYKTPPFEMLSAGNGLICSNIVAKSC